MHMLAKHQKKLVILLGLLMPVGFSCVLSFCLGYRVMINTTHSLPHTFYLSNPRHVPLKRGDYIAFKHKVSPLVVIKRVVGIEGDTIDVKHNAVCVNDYQFSLKGEKKDGTPLSAMSIPVVPADTVFVAGDHRDSFDSRYNEFGLVSLTEIRGRVWPVF